MTFLVLYLIKSNRFANLISQRKKINFIKEFLKGSNPRFKFEISLR